ncbi:glycosyltransferase family 2 protein [Paenibacillaceae bacterium]|nr:glycosyltransferase family 2 protein [Paenibacillaceae bacterium]
MNKLTSIIIPTYNGLALLERCIDAIRNHTDKAQTPYEIIIVDDGSSDNTAQWCVDQQLRLITQSTNRGFPAACNKGLRLASGDRLVLLNNDVIVSSGWLLHMGKALESAGNVGLVGPMSNYANGRQQQDTAYNDMNQFHLQAAKQLHSQAGYYEPVLRLVGLCLLFERELLNTIGELDERFGLGHYEDDDFCYRARAQGYQLLLCRNVLVHHEGHASFSKHNAQHIKHLLERNKQLFMDKWQVDPALFH